jgi:hypothetical protein
MGGIAIAGVLVLYSDLEGRRDWLNLNIKIPDDTPQRSAVLCGGTNLIQLSVPSWPSWKLDEQTPDH